MPTDLPRRQRVAAYAVVARTGRVLLSRLAPRVSRRELWTLPGGGLDHGEDPRDAVVREVREETGLHAQVGQTARVYSWHRPRAGRRGEAAHDFHALRIVYEGWVPPDAPTPRVEEVDGSTVEAAWHDVDDVLGGRLPVVPLVTQALADHRPHRLQRVAAYGVITRSSPARELLLTRLSARAAHPGAWTLPGGGVDHGESPVAALVREVEEECGVTCRPGRLLGVHDTHFTGTAPDGRREDYHGIHLVHEAVLPPEATPRLTEVDGTTDAVAWVPVADVATGRVETLDVVRWATTAAGLTDREETR